MVQETGKLEAARPAQIAREMLGDALAQIQDIRGAALDVQDVTASIAKAVGALFAVQSTDPSEDGHVAGVCHAMDELRHTLELLQDVQSDESALQGATQTIAKTLAALYPVSKVQERQSMIADRAPSVISDPIEHDARRSAARLAIEADIGFQSDNNFFTGFTEDISTGGIFVSTFNTRPIGDRLCINFTLPDGHLVTADGVVRWVREFNEMTPGVEPGMGVQFETLKREDEDAINGFLKERQPMFYDE